MTLTTRKFYRTVLEVEVLSEDPLPAELHLTGVAYEIAEGGYSGWVHTVVTNEEHEDADVE